MQIRVFQEEDTEPLIRLWHECGLTVPWNDPRRDIERKRAVQPELFLVGVVEGALMASVMAGYDGHRGWLYYLAVAPGHRRCGYGRAIVAEAEQRLAVRGCPKVNLMVRTANTAVVGFYHGLGYAADEIVSLGKRLVQD